MDGFMSEKLLTAFAQFGIAGLILLVMAWWMWLNAKDRKESNKCVTDLLAQYKDESANTLSQYREDIAEIKRLYENNAHLVKEYDATCKRLEALYGETLSVISLNTQTQTRLVESIKNNLYCPMVRKKGESG